MIETELLELAQGVFFRLLKEEGYSRTAFVKIRYEDFSTVSIVEFGKLKKIGSSWEFEALGDGYNKELDYLVDKYVV